MSFATIRIACQRAVELKNRPQGVIRGYIAIWGDSEHRDSYNTWFDRERPPEMALDSGMHRRPIHYEHSQDGVIAKEVVGVIDEIFFDEIGIGFIGHLYQSSPFFDRVISEVASGELKTSSATMEHTAEFYEDGAFKHWDLGELSLTKTPSESRMPEVALVRSVAEGERDVARDGDELLLPEEPIETGGVPEPPQRSNLMNLEQILNDLIAQGASAQDIITALLGKFPIEDIMAALQQQQAPVQEPVAAAAGTDVPTQMSAPRSAGINVSALVADLQRRKDVRDHAAEMETMRSQMAQMQQRLDQQVAAPPVQDTTRHAGGNGGVGANINLIESRRYARYSHMEFMAAAEIARQNPSLRGIPGEGFMRALAHRQLDFLQHDERESVDPLISFVRSTYTRADDFMATDIAGQGTEWVGVMYGTKIWEKARIQPITEALLARGMMEEEVPDGANSVWIPLEDADPTFYTTSQANDLDATNRPEVVVNIDFAGTARVQVTPGQLTGAVVYTDIQAEDNLFDVGSQINRQLQLKGPEVVEGLAINGDTVVTANTNINLIDGTPGTGLNKPYYLASDGILKLPLVTASTLSRDAGNAHTEDDYKATIAKLPDELIADPDNLLFLLGVQEYQKALTIPSLKTLDVAGQQYTLLTGKLPPIYGVQPFRTGRMALANTSGKISGTGSNNTRGRLACVYAKYWAMVWKRRMSFENARFPLSQANAVIASFRIAFRRRSDNAAALSYNLAV